MYQIDRACGSLAILDKLGLIGMSNMVKYEVYIRGSVAYVQRLLSYPFAELSLFVFQLRLLHISMCLHFVHTLTILYLPCHTNGSLFV